MNDTKTSINDTFYIEGKFGWSEKTPDGDFHYEVQNPTKWSPGCVGTPVKTFEKDDDGYVTVRVKITQRECPGCGGLGGHMPAPANCDAFIDCETCNGDRMIDIA